MADRYSIQQTGVADGTEIPADKADGRQVGASKTVTLASKRTDEALVAGDRMFLGYKPAGCKLTGVTLTTDTSLATTTVAIGDDTTADKYAAAATLTAIDTPTKLGVKATTLDDDPTDEQEAIWATFAVAGVGAAVALTFELEFTGIA